MLPRAGVPANLTGEPDHLPLAYGKVLQEKRPRWRPLRLDDCLVVGRARTEAQRQRMDRAGSCRTAFRRGPQVHCIFIMVSTYRQQETSQLVMNKLTGNSAGGLPRETLVSKPMTRNPKNLTMQDTAKA